MGGTVLPVSPSTCRPVAYDELRRYDAAIAVARKRLAIAGSERVELAA
jgi:hypothetical protein